MHKKSIYIHSILNSHYTRGHPTLVLWQHEGTKTPGPSSPAAHRALFSSTGCFVCYATRKFSYRLLCAKAEVASGESCVLKRLRSFPVQALSALFTRGVLLLLSSCSGLAFHSCNVVLVDGLDDVSLILQKFRHLHEGHFAWIVLRRQLLCGTGVWGCYRF